jgi:predicted ester cyclase
MRDFASAPVRAALAGLFTTEAMINLCHPFGTLTGPDNLYQSAYAPLLAAMPDLQRTDWIVMDGADEDGAHWIGTGGHYEGTFRAPFLDIPPTGHLAHMRFHEFYRIENGRAVEMQALWDIPQLMMQAGAWPMAPQRGAFHTTPGPATQDGLRISGDGTAARDHILAMHADMTRYPGQGGPEVMNLPKYWHPAFNWYGPAGIGTSRGIDGFRAIHQEPFLRGMPDRGQNSAGTKHHFIAQGDYCAVTGWPNMRMTHTGDGWLGQAPTGNPLLLRSLDFWRVENGLIRENWVMVDILDALRQMGVDALARMREFQLTGSPI